MGKVTVEQLRALHESGKPYKLIDIREVYERDVCLIEGSIHIPLSELIERKEEFIADIPVIVHCKSGNRSKAAIDTLKRYGATEVLDLDGGILAWIDQIQPTLDRY